MSKATFYEHFAQQGGVHPRALRRRHRRRASRGSRRPRATTGTSRRRAASAPRCARSSRSSTPSPTRRRRCSSRSSAPGPRAARAPRRRARALRPSYIDEANKADAEAGVVDRASPRPHDAFAIVGAIVELASRQLRTRQPEDMRDLEPVIERLVLGLVGAAPPRRARCEHRAARRSSADVTSCRACPRLVAWREHVAREKRAAFAGRDVLGPPDPRLRRPGRARADPRPRARRARRQPHGPRVHRRPLRRLAVRGAAPHRLRQPADVRARATTGWRCATAGSPPRCAARRRPTSRCREERERCCGVAGARARAARAAARRRLPRRVRVGGGAAHAGAVRAAAAAPAAALRPRRRAPAALHCSAASTPASRTRSPAS